MPRIRRKLALATVLAAGCVTALAAPATVLASTVHASTMHASTVHASTGQTPAAAPWKIALKVTGSGYLGFSAIAVSSPTSAWAFDANGTSAPAAYQLSGSTWTKRAFPAPAGDEVFSASASSPSNVWAFTFKGDALRYNGTSWSKVKHFTQPIGSGVAISSTDVWVFSLSDFGRNIGAVHYNGSTWTKVASGSGLLGASALSAGSIWGYGGTNVAHWNGSTWKKTSVKHLLPKNTVFGQWAVTGIYAASVTSVYAVASGETQDVGGPVALLHYNGHAWRRIFATKKPGDPVGLAPDGSGGLWVPIAYANTPLQGSIRHFTHGALNTVPLPYGPLHLTLDGIGAAPHSKVTFAVGLYHKKTNSFLHATAVILRIG